MRQVTKTPEQSNHRRVSTITTSKIAGNGASARGGQYSMNALLAVLADNAMRQNRDLSYN